MVYFLSFLFDLLHLRANTQGVFCQYGRFLYSTCILKNKQDGFCRAHVFYGGCDPLKGGVGGGKVCFYYCMTE
jgi:hypothetical protein